MKTIVRDTSIVLPLSLVVLALFWVVDHFCLGATRDLLERWIPIYFLCWILAWALVFITPIFPAAYKLKFSLIRYAVIVLLFYIFISIGTCLAEEWTIAFRKATWKEVGDLGYTYLYPEDSGMGYARGFGDIQKRLKESIIWTLLSGIVWFPLLFCLLALQRNLERRNTVEQGAAANP